MSTVNHSSEPKLKRTPSMLSSATTLADVAIPSQSHLTGTKIYDSQSPAATITYDYTVDKERGVETSEEPVPKKILGIRSKVFWLLAIILLVVVCASAVIVAAVLTRHSSSHDSGVSSDIGRGPSTGQRTSAGALKRWVDGDIVR
ncbi:hypothetical protein V1517DRAFT_336042 [Lipomyces orientalis]|uniref:Uncharacterized protein n=1 Tax=Lipomyces orientalis TaxID=1233043 RepID=A0ACC3TW10_9ASCO